MRGFLKFSKKVRKKGKHPDAISQREKECFSQPTGCGECRKELTLSMSPNYFLYFVYSQSYPMHLISDTFKGLAKIRKYQKVKCKCKFRDNELVLTVWGTLKPDVNALSESEHGDNFSPTFLNWYGTNRKLYHVSCYARICTNSSINLVSQINI